MSAEAWPVLSLLERRVLGVLIEKQKTTPETYPLSLNGVVTGSNQKSNRDPVLSLDDHEAEEALVAGQKKGLVMKVISGRVEKWRHLAYDVWTANKVDMAILAELLLRGPQTEGELRGRASRMEPIDDLDALRTQLRALAERKLVVYLTPEGKRGTVVTHGFHDPAELEALRQRSTAAFHDDVPAPVAARPVAVAAAPVVDRRYDDLRAEVAELRQQLLAATAQINQLADDVRRLKTDLGVSG